MQSISDIDREGVLRRITNRIRQSLELPEILSATVSEVRDLLGTDRVMVYRFHRDESGEVIAESIHNQRLPSLLGLNFPADDIPPQARQMFLKARVRSLVDLAAGKIGLSALVSADGTPLIEDTNYRQVDPCHVEYLTAMGVQSSLVVPILHHDLQRGENEPVLWGLLVSHYSQPHTISEKEVQIVQVVADQVAIAIAQSNILAYERQKRATETTINRVSTLLHSLPTIELQEALNETVAALQGAGGRIYIAPTATQDESLYTCGEQPAPLDPTKNRLLEAHPIWQGYFQSDDSQSNSLQAITDLYQEPLLRSLASTFRTTHIRGLLVVPLQYHQQFVGYLSIFRNEIDVETMWAGHFDPKQNQLQPRNSFETWKELKKGQAQEWTTEDIKLAGALGHHFSMAIQQNQMYCQVQANNITLEQQVQKRTSELQQSLELANALKQIATQIRSTLDLKTLLQTIVQEVQNLLLCDRVLIYQFIKDWQGEVVVEAMTGNWISILGNRYEDDCFPQEYAELHKPSRVQVITNVVESNLTTCHIEFLQEIQVQANLVVPIWRNEQVWGLLIAHHCQAPREWKTWEVQLLQQLADQGAIAIHQAELYQQSCTAAATATAKAQQQQALFGVITKIRESLDLDTIFNATATELQHLLDSDRVGVFRFTPDSGWNEGKFVSEAVKPEFISVLVKEVEDRCFGDRYAKDYHNGRIQAIADINTADLSDCHRQILAQFQIRANLIVPLMKGDYLWGLLCLHQCSQPRQWKPSEIDFVKQIATHLGVALQQAELLAQTQQQTEQLQHTLSELQQTQSQLIQNEKMSSLGQLVAGIAHEINNPVNFIYGNISHVSEYAQDLLDLLHLYQEHYPDPVPEIDEHSEAIDLDFLDTDLLKILTSMRGGAERIRQLVLSLRNFSHLDQAESKPIDLHEGLDSTLLILQHRMKVKSTTSGIEVIKEYGDLPLVECYAGQMNQVFMNVISNAIDAIDEERRSPGQIRIRTRLLQQHPPNHKDSVVIQISDNGAGMSETVQAKIFNPFFTTKPIGSGTGLGLAISYKIVVEKHHGIFKCTSQLNEGTEFWIEIPIN